MRPLHRKPEGKSLDARGGLRRHQVTVSSDMGPKGHLVVGFERPSRLSAESQMNELV